MKLDSISRACGGWLNRLLLFGLLLPAIAQAAGLYDKGLLWRVAKPGLAPNFVFGTIHVDDPRVVRLPPAVTRHLDASATFTMELALDPSLLRTLAGRMVYADGRDLEQAAGGSLFGKVAAAAPLGLPPEVLRLLRPWALTMLLVMPAPQQGEVLDMVLLQRARDRGKPVHELESVDEQVAVFEGLPEREQLLMLRHTVDNLPQLREGVREMIEAWLARDLAALARIGARAWTSDPELLRFHERFRAALIDDRNTRMVQRMQPRLAAGGAFVAVGALHLHGARGILAQLAASGYAVTREY